MLIYNYQNWQIASRKRLWPRAPGYWDGPVCANCKTSWQPVTLLIFVRPAGPAPGSPEGELLATPADSPKPRLNYFSRAPSAVASNGTCSALLTLSGPGAPSDFPEVQDPR